MRVFLSGFGAPHEEMVHDFHEKDSSAFTPVAV
jgi:hypothetical protein